MQTAGDQQNFIFGGSKFWTESIVIFSPVLSSEDDRCSRRGTP